MTLPKGYPARGTVSSARVPAAILCEAPGCPAGVVLVPSLAWAVNMASSSTWRLTLGSRQVGQVAGDGRSPLPAP